MMGTPTRRDMLAATAVTAATTAAAGSLIAALPAAAAGKKPPICLVHGAWHGAWAWTKLVPLLVQEGYPVTTLDLSGLGANYHRQAPEIGLHVHGRDVLNHLFFNDIRDAVVVGHSYGGCVLSEALAGDTDKRIAHAVYLDALVPAKGKALVSYLPPKIRAQLEKAAAAGEMRPPRPPQIRERLWGLKGDNAAFAAPRLKPMSARCLTEAVQGEPFRDGVRYTYLRCTQNKNRLFDFFAKQTKADPRFKNAEIDGHHDVMIIDPPRMKDALLAAMG